MCVLTCAHVFQDLSPEDSDDKKGEYNVRYSFCARYAKDLDYACLELRPMDLAPPAPIHGSDVDRALSMFDNMIFSTDKIPEYLLQIDALSNIIGRPVYKIGQRTGRVYHWKVARHIVSCWVILRELCCG